MLSEALKSKTFNLTGHRPPTLGGYNKNTEENRWLLEKGRQFLLFLSNVGFERMITGMAQGWDQWMLEESILLGRFKNIAAIPCLNQEKKWPEDSQRVYHHLLKHCDVHYVSDKPYDRACMQERNMWMVDRAVASLAAYKGVSGGTENCLMYARRREHLIYCIDSNSRKTYMVWADKKFTFPG